MSKIKLILCAKCAKEPTYHFEYGNVFDRCYVDCTCGNKTDVFYNERSPKEQWNYLNSNIKKMEETNRLIENGKKWDALLSSCRIRNLGSAKLGETTYQHIGMELWHFEDKKHKEKFNPAETVLGREVFEKYVKGIIATNSEE